MDDKTCASLLEEVEKGSQGSSAKKRRLIAKPGPPDAPSGNGQVAALVPRTAKEDLVDIMPSLLDDAAQARKHATALAQYGLSDQSKTKLTTFATWCDEIFQKAQKETSMKKGQCDEKLCKNMLAEIRQKRHWFETVRPVHESMMRGLKAPKGKAKAKARAQHAPGPK